MKLLAGIDKTNYLLGGYGNVDQRDVRKRD